MKIPYTINKSNTTGMVYPINPYGSIGNQGNRMIYPTRYKIEDYIDSSILESWYDFTDSSTVTTDSYGVNQVEDKSDNNYTATQTVNSNKALYDGNALSFAENKFLDLNLDYIANQNHFCIAVLKQTDYLDGVYGAVNVNSGSNSPLIGFKGGNPPSSYRIEFWGNNFRPNVVNFNFSNYNIVVWEWLDSTSRSVKCNGYLEGSTTTNESIGLPDGGGRLGSNVVGKTSNFDIKEIIFVTGSEVTNDNVEKLEYILALKHGLINQFNPDHPYL
jgi:hypothetical protein